MNPIDLAAATAGGLIMLAVVAIFAAVAPGPILERHRSAMWSRATSHLALSLGRPTGSRSRRGFLWCAVGIGVWVLTGWPVAGLAVVIGGLWLPWLLGSARTVHDRLATLEALERWCRRMADMLTGGGAIGLTQAVAASADRGDGPIGDAVRVLAHRLRTTGGDAGAALREFADTVDDRAGDAVAAALLLALHTQTPGVAQVLRQLADGTARDIRARREIEASRAENRQSVRMLLLIQVGLLVLLALVPGFAAPYATATGQVVMGVLLAATAALLVWMRRLALGRPAPRFMGGRGEAP